MPLWLYFVDLPQALTGRTDAIAVSAGEALTTNPGQLLRLHFGGGWLGQWPALNPLLALGLLAGLIVCLRHIRRRAAWVSLAWLGLGWLPVLLSRQDWDATTTVLRGIVAWPAVCLIAAGGLTALVAVVVRHIGADRRAMAGGRFPPSGHCRRTIVIPAYAGTGLVLVPTLALLAWSAGASVCDYFVTWAGTFDGRGIPASTNVIPAVIPAKAGKAGIQTVAGYLNSHTDAGQHPLLCPNRLCTAAETAFLLQARYPDLAGPAPDAALARPAAILVPLDGEAPSAWLLLDPAGVAYVLPQLTDDQAERLMALARVAAPAGTQTTLTDDRGQPIAEMRVLDRTTAELWRDSPPAPLPAYAGMDAVFGGDLRLAAFDVQPAQVRHSQAVTLRLAWQALRPVDGDYDLFIHVFHLASGRRVGQINESLGSALLLPVYRWPAGAPIVDQHTFSLPDDAPEGAYRFEIGLYHRASLARLPVVAAAFTAADSLVLGKFRLQDAPPPPPAFAITALFEDNISLLGLDMTDIIPDRVSLVLHWRAEGPVVGDYTVFTHLLDEQGNLMAQQDNQPGGGTYPTALWSAGEVVRDPYVLPLPTPLLDGDYALQIGLYDASTGRRLRRLDGDGDHADVALRAVGGRLSPREVSQ